MNIERNYMQNERMKDEKNEKKITGEIRERVNPRVTRTDP